MDKHTKYKRTKGGLIAQIYSDQRRNSKRRGHTAPTYSLDELREWVYNQDEFINLYTTWVASGYDRWKRPSLNRISNDIGYSLCNIELMTSYDNLKLEKLNPKPVLRSDGIRYNSILEAERANGYPEGKSKISLVCRGKRKSYKGYTWEFINKEDCPYELDTNTCSTDSTC